MTKIIKPLPEEHAYHIGWQSYFSIGTGAENPYSEETEKSLYDKWVEGQRTAKTVEGSLQDL